MIWVALGDWGGDCIWINRYCKRSTWLKIVVPRINRLQ